MHKEDKTNPWLAHVKIMMRNNRGLSFKQVLKLAKKSYKSSGSKLSAKSRRGSTRRNRQRGGNSLLGEKGVAANAASLDGTTN